MKKFILVLFFLITTNLVFASDKFSSDYLKNNKHFSPGKSLIENMVQSGIKGALKKETGSKFKVKFSGYTLSSLKKGIFKYVEVKGENVNVQDIVIPYVHVVSLSDYNYIDYKSNPIQLKSDMEFAYDMVLTEDTINSALACDEYKKVMNKVNNIAYPLFVIKAVRTKIMNNRTFIIIDYNFPIAQAKKDKSFVASTNFQVVDGEVRATEVRLNSVYGNISLDKVANLINLLNPLEFTLDLLDSKKCDANIENVNIIDNKIKINGKIFVKGD